MVALTKTELRELLAKAYSEDWHKWLMLLVTFNHGLRVSETISLTKQNFKDGYLIVQRLKGSLKTVQPLVFSKDSIMSEKEELEAYLETLKDSDKLFPICRMTVWRCMQHFGKLAGIPSHKLHPHTLKHSIAMLSIKAAGIENVRQYLGHKSIASTGQYLRVDDEKASEAVTGAL